MTITKIYIGGKIYCRHYKVIDFTLTTWNGSKRLPVYEGKQVARRAAAIWINNQRLIRKRQEANQ